MKLKKNEKGQGMIEYLIIVALIAISSMAIMRVMSQSVRVRFANVTSAIQGTRRSNLRVEAIEDRHVDKSDMSDFFHGAVSNDRNNR